MAINANMTTKEKAEYASKVLTEAGIVLLAFQEATERRVAELEKLPNFSKEHRGQFIHTAASCSAAAYFVGVLGSLLVDNEDGDADTELLKVAELLPSGEPTWYQKWDHLEISQEVQAVEEDGVSLPEPFLPDTPETPAKVA